MKPALSALLFAALVTAAEPRQAGWILVLGDPPLEAAAGPAHASRALAIAGAQAHVAALSAARGWPVTGHTDTLLNAVFVSAPPSARDELSAMPGVVAVFPDRLLRRAINKAVPLVNAPNAWALLGGAGNAGAGVKIGVIDTGVDHNHPAFNPAGFSALPGYPKCEPADCAYTSAKVVAARSYVRMLTNSWSSPINGSPDDNSARDRVGHGTAVAMVAAGVLHSTPLGEARGIAPQALVGSYKVFGSPGIYDTTQTSVVIQALEDAYRDGMNIVTLALSIPAEWGATDRNPACPFGNPNDPCDPWTAAVENAVSRGLVVVAAAGNEGDAGQIAPSLNSIRSPGTAPNVITVGASTNAHRIFQSARLTGGDVPASLQRVNGLFGDGPRPATPLTAPLKDVSKLQNDGLACAPLTNGSLNGSIALIQAGGCSLRDKVNVAVNAGALGVIFMRKTGNDFVYPPTGLQYTAIPLLLIGNKDGVALGDFLAAHPDRPVTLDPALSETDDSKNADAVAYFSSYGPSIGTSAIKPELVAPGTDMLLATQSYDPNSEMYDASGYTVAQGTSFAAPVAAGAAALVLQKNPSWRPAQVKSALVNTATDKVDDLLDGGWVQAHVTAVGAGRLDAAAAVRTTVTANPAVVSFGASTTGAFQPVGVSFVNNNASSITLRLSAAPRSGSATNGTVTINPSVITLNPGSTSLNVSIGVSGARNTPGTYEGAIVVDGGPVQLRLPYLYLISDGVAQNIIPLKNFDYTGLVNFPVDGGFLLKVVDRFGLPVPNLSVVWTVKGGGRIEQAMQATDSYGMAEATKAALGPGMGYQTFTATIGNLPPVDFFAYARPEPAIVNGGVVNAGSFEAGRGLAPGSYITIRGRGLAEAMLPFFTPYLPVALGATSVAFYDNTGQPLSPGRLHFVRDDQVNVQIPWELAGKASAQLRVWFGNYGTASYALTLNGVSPAAFEWTAPSGRRLFAAQDVNYGVIYETNPIRRGQTIVLYMNGLGPVDNQPPSGEPTPSSPLARVLGDVQVTIGGRPATVAFAGLTPSSIGLYQINAVVPNDAPTLYQPVVVTVDGVASKAADVYIQ